jgi:23S rRNA (uracil1939-C5)-methyltransferase
VTTETREIEIGGLGAQGDGIAQTPDGPSFLPYALPGERWRIGDSGSPQASPELVSAPSPERRKPTCRHFATCGGCVAQHMSDTLYASWKRGIVVEALRQHGIDAAVAPLHGIAPGSRRRAVLTARQESAVLVLGYHRRRSHELFALEECPVLQPAIVARLAGLRAIAALLARREVRLTVLLTAVGLDVTADSGGSRLSARVAGELARLAADHGIARITIDGETIVERARPALVVGGASVEPPPGAFVQVAAEAEHEMVRLVVTAAGKAKRVADLFCGVGTFTLPLARGARVLAVDGEEAAVAALTAAARHAQGLKPIETKVRDLFRMPLSPKELDGLDAVVLDPARAGAEAQTRQLARSTVPVAICVSCNPGTLARDVRILLDGGYALDSVTPIDQFLYSDHVEAVAVLRRPVRSRRAS